MSEEEEAGLRARLVATGVELLAAEGLQALTLREIARRAGVSHGAPRRYFPTHLELLSAIARQGFADLAARTAAGTAEPQAGPREQLAALARGYLDFALANRGMYELMFRHDILRSGHLGLRDTSLPLFAALAELVGRVRPDAGSPTDTAAALWANLHGLAQLWAWGSLQLATGRATDGSADGSADGAGDPGPLLHAVLDAHLGPAAGERG